MATQRDGSIARLRQRSSSETTVAFADLAGFTALTGTYSDDDAIAVTRRFDATVRSVLAEPESFVKLIGDTALLVFTEPQQAILALAALLEEAGHNLLPAVRIDIHTGRVNWSDQDPCGPVVKLALRVAALASGSQILATWSVARLLPPGAWFDVGPRRHPGQHRPRSPRGNLNIGQAELGRPGMPDARDPWARRRNRRARRATMGAVFDRLRQTLHRRPRPLPRAAAGPGPNHHAQRTEPAPMIIGARSRPRSTRPSHIRCGCPSINSPSTPGQAPWVHEPLPEESGRRADPLHAHLITQGDGSCTSKPI